jgi:uncharacterized protein YdaU (DUF1376 family)
MHFYIRHLGDYARDTANLSALEVGIYDLMLDFYYSTEKPLPLNQADLRNIARCSNPHIAIAMNKVLATFFTKTAQGYFHKRAEEEIAKARIKSSKAQASAAARWGAAKRDANASGKEGEDDANAHANVSPDNMRSHRSSNASQEASSKPKTLTPVVTGEVSGALRAGARRKSIASLLNGAGVVCSAAHAQVVAWALDDAVSDEVLEAALVVMRQRKPRDPKPQYLKPIIDDLIAQQEHAPHSVTKANGRGPPRHRTPVQQREAEHRRVIEGLTGYRSPVFDDTTSGEVIDVNATESPHERTKRLKHP